MKAITENLYADVLFLTSVTPARNYQNLDTLEKVLSYIQSEFKKIGLQTSEQKWIAKGNEYSNCIASYHPEKKKRLIVGAHYDVCGDQPGADDNASAVAGLLETARMISANKPEMDYGIDFVAYCLEEPPFFDTELMGSYIHAKSLHENNTEVVGMICYEMIGYFSDAPNSQKYPDPRMAAIYPSTADFIVVVGIDAYEAFRTKVYKSMVSEGSINVQTISFPDTEGLASLSDHSNYWKFGYNAIMINDTSFIRNPNYHQESDTIDTLDFKKMTEVVNASYKAITHL